mmetsp:Transcript_55152/g.120155  ORF Transcript_55152/g.120155 Transcript_55152/m.120155 type:complete len:156 (+) Transcript_55152:820-1287(+)
MREQPSSYSCKWYAGPDLRLARRQIDECTSGGHDCASQAVCSNTMGSLTCSRISRRWYHLRRHSQGHLRRHECDTNAIRTEVSYLCACITWLHQRWAGCPDGPEALACRFSAATTCWQQQQDSSRTANSGIRIILHMAFPTINCNQHMSLHVLSW